MPKTILITGSTDGLGLETAKALVKAGHRVVVHGRSQEKIDRALAALAPSASQEMRGVRADLSSLEAIPAFVTKLRAVAPVLDVVINNAGVYKVAEPILPSGLDARFVVNTIAPYALVKQLTSLFAPGARVVNLSSAAQAPLDMEALRGRRHLDDGTAYAQSKLALTSWTYALHKTLAGAGPVLIAVNPGSFLATKMVREAYGSSGRDISQGVDILLRAALSEEFASAGGRYFDNDSGRFADPHPEALDIEKGQALLDVMDGMLARD
mgnify:CR=1 FL=1